MFIFWTSVSSSSGAFLAIERRLDSGTAVRSRSGTLKGMEGIVVKRYRKTRLLVAVKCLQEGVFVEIDDCALERM